MANVRIQYDRNAIGNLMKSHGIARLLQETAEKVRSEAEATASSAENGPGGTIDGYSGAGFSVVYENRGKRPRMVIKSNAPGKTAMAAHFHTQRRDGVAHLRAALYKFTKRG